MCQAQQKRFYQPRRGEVRQAQQGAHLILSFAKADGALSFKKRSKDVPRRKAVKKLHPSAAE